MNHQEGGREYFDNHHGLGGDMVDVGLSHPQGWSSFTSNASSWASQAGEKASGWGTAIQENVRDTPNILCHVPDS